MGNRQQQYKNFLEVNQAQNGLINSIRENASKEFESVGIPTKKIESWKYTSLRDLDNFNISTSHIEAKQKNIAEYNQSELLVLKDSKKIVLLNGRYEEGLSDIKSNGGVRITPIEKSTPTLKSLLENKESSAMRSLALAHLNHAYVVEVDKDYFRDEVVQMICCFDSPGSYYPIIFFNVGAGSKLTFSQVFLKLKSDEQVFVNSVLEANIGENANLCFYHVNFSDENAITTSNQKFNLNKFSNLDHMNINLGGKLNRNDLNVKLNGESSSCQINGIYKVKGSEHYDCHSTIEFCSGNATSSQLYKGLLNDSSRAVFDGLVKINPGSQKVSSEQLNNNLLLSSDAEVDSKPQLQIYADDVKATHGSTVGDLSKDELFYMQSRAIPKSKAVEILSRGFLAEVVYRCSDKKIREWLLNLI